MKSPDSSPSGSATSDVARALHRWGLPPALLQELSAVTDETTALYLRLNELAADELSERRSTVARRRAVREVNGSDSAKAWMYRTSDPGDITRVGSLKGQRLAVKDCIQVTGVPMTLGTDFFRHLPTSDAPAVSRALASGASLAGTTVCEALCLSGSSFTSATGAVPNPFDPERSAGGSSSGSAVVVALGEADIALGTDLGGSVRNPASWCGVTGLKPTFGVIPYTGAMATEASMDHIGLIARRAQQIEPFLVALAGPDGVDHRQVSALPLRPLTEDPRLRIGLVSEGFGHALADPRVDDAVRSAAHALGSLHHPRGVMDISIPLHTHAPDIHAPIAGEGALITLFERSLQDSNDLAFYDDDLAENFAAAIRERPADLPLNAVATLVATSTARMRNDGTVIAKAQRMRRALRAQYNNALTQHDLLIMPTVPMLPHRLPRVPLSMQEHRRLAFEMHDNNCATNLTGHPSITIPCAVIDGMPVGLLLIGRHFEDRQLIAAAAQFQENCFEPPIPQELPRGRLQ